jgi:hypothetical protein
MLNGQGFHVPLQGATNLPVARVIGTLELNHLPVIFVDNFPF